MAERTASWGHGRWNPISFFLEMHAQSEEAMEVLGMEGLILLRLGEGDKTFSLRATGGLRAEILHMTSWLCSALPSTGEGTEPE